MLICSSRYFISKDIDPSLYETFKILHSWK